MVVQRLSQQLTGARKGAPVGQILLPVVFIERQAEALGVIEAAEQLLLPVHLLAGQGLLPPDGLYRRHVLVLRQVETAPFRLRGRDRLVQDAIEQGIEAALGRQRPPHAHEIAEGLPHAGHGAGQIVDLADRRVGPLALVKVEVLDPLRLPGQRQQGGRGTPRHQPDDGQQQQQAGQGPGQIDQGFVTGLLGENVRRHQQGDVEGGALIQGGEVDQPVVAILRGQGQLGRPVQQGGLGRYPLLQLGQYGVLEHRQRGQPAQLLEAGQPLGIRRQQGA
ncbi:hypothetical protein D3C78_1231840 [compost metagenome]